MAHFGDTADPMDPMAGPTGPPDHTAQVQGDHSPSLELDDYFSDAGSS